MADVQVTAHELYQQAATQIDPIKNLAALETQSDVISYTIQNLIKDLEAANLTMSTNTKNGLALLQQIAQNSTISDEDVATPSTSTPVNNLTSYKAAIRTLQKKYYQLKAQFGL